MSSMAATLAGLQPAPVAAPTQQQQQQQARRAAGAQAGHIPARYEEALDVEGELPINDVELNGTVSRAPASPFLYVANLTLSGCS